MRTGKDAGGWMKARFVTDTIGTFADGRSRLLMECDDSLRGTAAPTKGPVLRSRVQLPLRPGLAALVLFVATVAVFAPALHFQLVDYDDSLYVTKVPVVERGLTTEGVRWAFTTFHATNWHPLTW
ncbi:MAG TPA: hypothetical protein DEP35_18145, partial [Deltaproteobacteria bacterium]|nr:hypothetical protein [Deltaproteobacteria bacterium]